MVNQIGDLGLSGMLRAESELFEFYLPQMFGFESSCDCYFEYFFKGVDMRYRLISL